MTTSVSRLAELSDCEVLARVHDAARDERTATAQLIALLMELDARRLYLGEGCSSLFTYCTQLLHLSEHAAYNRIETARAARRFPVILELVESAALTLTTVRLLAPHLTDANHHDVLDRARHKTKREIELLVATLDPRRDVTSMVRKLPAPATSQLPTSVPQGTPKTDISIRTEDTRATMPPPRPAEVKPIAPERYKIQFTVSRETHDKLRRAQDLLRHSVPNGDPAVIFERAIALLVADLERKRIGKVERPRAVREATQDSRHIPAAVKRTVWQRDNGRCAFNGPHGRCNETGVPRISPCGAVCVRWRNVVEQSRAAVPGAQSVRSCVVVWRAATAGRARSARDFWRVTQFVSKRVRPKGHRTIQTPSVSKLA